MTENRRIFLNIIATYGRSLFSLVCGLFSARWVLGALGASDYGLYGVVGGLTVFIAFFNHLLATANSRFYAIAIGRARVAEDREKGLDECRRWFNTALMIHVAIPIVATAIGYPLGLYAIKNWLAIPADRLETSIWVFRFVCIACFAGMVEVPFSAMYKAKQYIAELTVYSFAQTLLNFVFFYYMSTHAGFWLFKYALWMCMITSVPHVIIALRALVVFDECHINFAYWWNWRRVRELCSYAGWTAIAGIGGISRGQGLAILINQYFGSSVNAAMTIANQVNGQTQMLASAMQGAFAPAITSAYGAGDYKSFKALSFRSCKFGMLLVLIFLIPLSIELPTVMRLWLKNPPPYSIELCWCMMLALVVDKSAIGHMIAVNARGKIALYQSFLGGSLVLTLPVAWLFVELGMGVYGIGYAWSLMLIICALGRVVFAKSLVGFSISHWVFRIVCPVFVVSLAATAVGYGSHLIESSGLTRILYTTLFSEFVFAPLVWLFVLDHSERMYVSVRIKSIFGRKQ